MKLFRTFAQSTCAVCIPALVAAPAFADPVKQDGQWRGSVDAGFSAASGNTTSTSLNLGATANWADQTDKFTSNLLGLYGTSTDDNGNRTTSDDLIRANAEYDHDMGPKIYSMYTLDAERNELQDLNFRAAAAVALGYHFIKTDKQTFNVFTGLSYNYEIYKTTTRQYPELLLGEEYDQAVNDTLSLTERLAVYPNLGYIGNVRTQLDLGLVVKLTERLNLKLTYQDRYNSQPVEEVKKHDSLFVTSIAYTFGPK